MQIVLLPWLCFVKHIHHTHKQKLQQKYKEQQNQTLVYSKAYTELTLLSKAMIYSGQNIYKTHKTTNTAI